MGAIHTPKHTPNDPEDMAVTVMNSKIKGEIKSPQTIDINGLRAF